MAATIQDVAQHAGVSLGTVSKYINGKSVKEVNRAKIEKAIEVLHYKPNNIAKGLRNAKSFAVAVLIPMLSSTYCTTIISTIEKYLLPLGYSVIVCECHDDEEMELKKADFLLSKMVDGIILLPYSPKGKQLDLIQQNHVPVVLIDQLITNRESDAVILDNKLAIFEPTEYLIKSGHRKIALLIGNKELYTSKERLDGFRQAFEEYNLPIEEDLILDGNYSMAGSYQALTELYESNKCRPTAIICSNYEMTLGALLTMNTLNLKIPDDISVIGFDNLTLSKVIQPPLFTVEQPMEDMGMHAAELLYRRMDGDYSDYPCVISHKAHCISNESIKKLG